MLDTLGVRAERITTAVDVSDFLDRKRRAMEAHASQITDTSFFLTMPPEAFAAVWGTEWYIRVGARRRRRLRGLAARPGDDDDRPRRRPQRSRPSSSGEMRHPPRLPRLPTRRASTASSTASPSDDARRRLVPSGTTLLGLVKHLTFVEVYWAQRRFAGADVDVLRGDGFDLDARRHGGLGTPRLRRGGTADRRDRHRLRRSRTAPRPGTPRPHPALDARPSDRGDGAPRRSRRHPARARRRRHGTLSPRRGVSRPGPGPRWRRR